MRTTKNKKYNEIYKLEYYFDGVQFKDIFYYLTDTGLHGQSIPYAIDGGEFLMKYSGERHVVSVVNILYQYALDRGLTERQSAEGISEELARRIANRFKEKWQRIYNAMFASYNPIENYDSTESHSGDDTSSISSDSDITTKQSSYDTSDLETTSQVISNSNPINNYSKIDYNSTITKHGNIGVTTTQQMIESEIDLRQLHDFIDIIYGDIGSYLLANIF